MKEMFALLIIISAVGFAFAANDNQVLEFKSKIGFTKGEDKIIEHKFLESGSKILLIGEKTLQIWDVKNARLLNSVLHNIPQFAPKGISNLLLLGLPSVLSWNPYIIDPNGRWIITIEATADKKIKSAIVRDLQNVKQIAILDLPNISTDYVAFDERKDEILTFGEQEKNASFANWNADDFQVRRVVTINNYKTHLFIKNEEKMIVGSGDTKINWTAFSKDGNNMTLRDVKTGAVEKEYTAKNLLPETTFLETFVSTDEKFLLSKRDNRIFVWEIDGDRQPKFEISQPDPKGKISFKNIIDKRFIVVKIGEQLRVYDIEGNGTPKLVVSPQNPKEDVDFVQIIGEPFVIVKADSKIRVYDTQNGNPLKYEIVSENLKDTVEYRGSTEDGKYIVVRDDQKVSVFEVAGDGKPLYEIVRQSEKERFPVSKFIGDKNLLMVTQVNKSEKKAPRTEFYDISTGKLAFDAAFEANYDVKFTPDSKYLHQTGLGYFSVWNLITRKLLSIDLDTYTPNYSPDTPEYLNESPINSEYAVFSPDYRFILRYGDDLTAIFDTETGGQLQVIFDTETAKHNKHNKIKDSGLGDAGWSEDGKYVYAFDESGFFGKKRTVSFWNVAN